ncbi:MAG: 2-C-methyl-D-erythritol 4-phosphate cytidylyltransferase [Bacteroidetes bacterium]|nr:2-C-methyl-D-erythritol 4-phosphate cytidylyltransferase [Bacteroidota bacterium]
MEVRDKLIITAGGSGLRMGGDLPKQFLLLKGEPVIFRTLETFYRFSSALEIYVVLPPHYIDLWPKWAIQYDMNIPCTLVAGGFTRFHSVKNALAHIWSGGVTAVHDGVRPLVSQALIQTCFELAREHPAVVPVLEITDSMRRITDQGSVSVDRTCFLKVQTPQVFWTDILKKAYDQTYIPDFTDDASVVEKEGIPLLLTKGSARNIKITTPEDLALAEVL